MQSAGSTDHASTGKVNEGGQAHHLLPLTADVIEPRHLQGHQSPPTVQSLLLHPGVNISSKIN